MARRTPDRHTGNPVDVPAALAELDGLTKDEVANRFRVLYGTDPPRHVRREVLVRAVAHRIQENACGPDPALARRLARMAAMLRRTGSIPVERSAPTVKPGTRLLRAWNGENHSVTVSAAGYVYNGETYRSLSSIARTITGTRWSGPAFFGLAKGASRARASVRDTAGDNP